MRNAWHFYWHKALSALGWRDDPSAPAASPPSVPPPDAGWLAASALGEEDPGASLEALERTERPLKDPPH